MALIKLGSVVTRISGKVGGQTFGESASGAYLKNSGTPRKSITLSQRSKMSAMATTAQQWRALTQAQRDSFNAASPDYPYLNRVGETKFYSGYAIFCQLKNNGLNASFTGVPVPLPKITFSPVSFVDEGVPTSELFVEFSDPTNGVLYRLFCTAPSSKGVSSPYKNFFFMDQNTGDGASTLQINFSAGFNSKFGSVPASGKFFWRIDAISPATGQQLKGILSGSTSW